VVVSRPTRGELQVKSADVYHTRPGAASSKAVWIQVLLLLPCLVHRHGIDKYLDTLLANQTAWKALPLTVAKVVISRVILSLFLPNQSQRSSFTVIGYAEAGRRGVVCCNVEYLNFGMQKRVIFSGHLAITTIVVALSFIAGSAPVSN